MALVVAGTDFIQMPAGTTAQRPASPIQGMQRYNTTLGYTEVYDGSAWVGIGIPPDGTVTDPKISEGLTASTTYYPINGLGASNAVANTSLQKLASFRCLRGGTFNIRFRTGNFSPSTATIGSRVYVDGVAVGSTITGSLVEYTFRTDTHTSITVTRNQVVDVYGSCSAGGTSQAYVTNIQYGSVGSISMNAFTNSVNSSSSGEGLPI